MLEANVLGGLAVLFSLALLLLMARSQKRVLDAPAPPAPADLPPVSVLKPVKGYDPDLERNLRTVFRLQYPAFEVLFAAADPNDPALELARRVAAEFPHVPSRVVWGADEIGPNPKVNNLALLLPVARHEILWICDSNVAVPPRHLDDMVARLERPDVGLVWALFRGRGGGLGGALESLHLNAFVMGGMCGVHRVLGLPGAVGKSMMLRRRDLARIGGLEFLGRYLAEDQVCAEEIAARGMQVEISGSVVTNVLGRRSVGDFADRQLRWGRIRRRVNLAGYLAELLLIPLLPALVALAADPNPATGLLAGATLLVTACWAASAERRMDVHRPFAVYFVLEPIRAALQALLWPIPLIRGRPRWRGRKIWIGPRTLIRGQKALRSPRRLPLWAGFHRVRRAAPRIH